MDYITLALAKDYADQVAAGGGSGSVNLKDYYKKSEVDSKLYEKVNKIEGKGLSTNDYTTEEKEKLTSLENYNDEEIKNSISLKADIKNVYSKTEIDEKTSLISGYKGTVANENELPTENLVNGDVYRVESTNTNVMYKNETYSISNGSKIKTITFPEEVVYDENVNGKIIEFKSEDGTVLYTCTYQDEINYLSRFVTLTCGNLFTVVYTKEVETETFWKIEGNDTYTFDAELNVNSTFNSNIPFVSICNKGWETLSSDMNLSAYYTKPELESLRGFPFLQKVWYDIDKNSISTTDPKNSKIGNYSVALGDNTFAEGIRSFAMGAHSRATGDYSIAMGNQACTNQNNGCAIGEYVMTQTKNQTALGCYNKIDSDNLFVIGNGTNESSRSNAHTLSKNGIAWFEGDVYTGSTSGTNKDEGSIRLAKITELNTKVDKVEGKGLSTNDFTDDLKTKLTGIEDNAEVNKIDVIKINGAAAEIVDKAIDITIPGSKTYTYAPLIQRSPAIEVTNEEYCFTQNNNVFSIENPGKNSQSYITYINITEQDITNIMLNISILPTNTDDSFLETGCTLSIYKNPSSDNTKVFTSSTVIKKSLNIPVNTGDQLMLDWYSNGNMPYRNAIFKVEIDGYVKNEINTTEVENFIYENMSQLNRYTGYKIVDLSNNFFNIRNEVLPDVYMDENQGSNSVINIPLSNNQEYRISLENNSNESQVINVGFIDWDNLYNNLRYKTKLILETSYMKNVTYTFNIMNGVELPLYGDDVINNVFTPQRLKVYEITFTFNGFVPYGEIKGIPYPEPLT